MGRVAETANSLAIAVAATAVGCTLVLELAPTHHHGAARSAVPPAVPAAAAGPAAAGRAAVALGGPAVPEEPAADAVVGAPGPAPVEADDSRPAARPGGRIQVTGPAGPASLRAKGSFPVAWTNTTGTEVDVWLNAAAGRGRIQRLAMVSPRAGAGPAGEALVTLPEVPPGKAYALEVTAGNGAAHAFSRPFAVTD
ncbi:hypothetical protein ACH4VR_31725 [Streptomyces sp. NPDC020883]|uniref:hypothetical protein n=1 Tax=Streptomyces sp. NPDC020883 TaxID=3365099 RepID=UPI003792D81D